MPRDRANIDEANRVAGWWTTPPWLLPLDPHDREGVRSDTAMEQSDSGTGDRVTRLIFY